MQEESTQRTVALVVRAARLTEVILKRAIEAYLRDLENKEVPEKHGKMSVRALMGKDQGANTMDINNGNIRDFDRVASKYNIDYAIKKDRSEQPPKYVVFFKGRDADVISRAFKDFCDLNERKSKRPSLRQKLQKFRIIAPPVLNKEKIREKKLEKEASL
ncbi:MAG: PcfB family protein [Lachnospiraceae bacterium]|nr:PcfB family protein [Lachnospiraceae bacterium]